MCAFTTDDCKMKDVNSILLTGTINKAELKPAGSSSLLRLQVQTDPTGKEPAISLTAWLNRESDQALADEILEAANYGGTWVAVVDATDPGTIKENEFKFYPLQAELKQIAVGATGPASYANSAVLIGTVNLVDRASKQGGAWMVVDCAFRAKQPPQKREEPVYKHRYSRVFVPDVLLTGDIGTDRRILVHGQVKEKFGGTWHHHILANQISVA